MTHWIDLVFLQFDTENVHHSLTAEPVNEDEFNTITYNWTPKVTWAQYQETSTFVKNTLGMGHVRQRRDKLLKESDWVMTPDHFGMLTNQSEWIAYRKALRDLPASGIEIKWIFGNQVDFDNINFPALPPLSRA